MWHRLQVITTMIIVRKGRDSWCTFQKDQAAGTNKYKPGAGLPLKVIAENKTNLLGPEERRITEEVSSW